MEQNNSRESVSRGQETSSRLMFFLKADLMRQVDVNKIEVKGKENIENLPDNRRVVFVTTHLADSDPVIATHALGKFAELGITHSSTHNPKENLAVWLETLIAGKDNFYSIKHKKVGGKEIGFFNPDDYEKMKDAMDKGKSLVMASAYSRKDTKKNQIGAKLPDNTGYGPIYLAQKADALIVPVAVNYQPKDSGKPEVEVSVGKAIDFEKIDLKDFDSFLVKRHVGKELSAEEKKKFSETKQELKTQAGKIATSLASMLPQEKRGKW